MCDRHLFRRVREADPRLFQIAFLATLLWFVLLQREFTLGVEQMAVILLVALGTQSAFVAALRLPPPGPWSPLITGLSLCLLLRANSLWAPALAAAVGIASKFVLRAGGKHVFNPSNLGLMAVALTGDAWASPGQWGSGTLLAFGLGGLGLMTVGKVGRFDIAGSFLLMHLGLLGARTMWLGYEPSVFLHQARSGGLILFAFFMISDPRSTPDGRRGRIAFAVLVAVVAHVLRFHLFWSQSLLWALLFVSPVTPILDRVWPKPRFHWRDQGAPHEAPNALPDHRVATVRG